MTHEPRRTKTHTPAGREQPARDRDDLRERRNDRARRVGAAQMAAPSTRTWRRAGRFASST